MHFRKKSGGNLVQKSLKPSDFVATTTNTGRGIKQVRLEMSVHSEPPFLD